MMRTFVSMLLTAMLAMPAELPVRQVVLYKHGVGFFERSGRLGSGESARLDFNASEMNDVLKSLTIEEKGGGKISGLRYDSMDPLGHKLAEFPFEIGDGGLPGLLDHLRGARVELKVGNETLTGAIVTARTIPGSDKQPERDQLNLLLDSGELRTVDLSAVAGLRFSDPKLQQQFKDYLTAIAAARSKDKRSVYIDSTDTKEREVIASYMIPAPVWKSSYRLIFGATGQPVLEGWAIVDNTTGEDWTKVQLSLVSGRPISFVSQLYAPKYVTRPGAELADDAAARPVVHDGAFEAQTGAPGGVMGGVAGAMPAAQNRVGGNLQTMAMAAPLPMAKFTVPSSIVADATARELGDLFEYRIAQPVTIRKNESAMLPFLQQPINSRKLLIYSDHTSQHPTNAAELSNSTGKTLDGGPITVYDGGAYAGEALMETLKAGDKRLISYAVDLGTRITEAFGSKQAIVREIHANRGMLTLRSAAEETRTYTARNVDQKPKTLIIEHPLRQGYTLLSQKPAEKTPAAYRFEVPLAAGATQEFAVAEERVFDQSYSVSSLSPDAILTYVQNRSLSDAAKRQLQGIAAQKSKIAANDRDIQQAESEVRDLNTDEDRIRRNIQSLNAVSGQQQQVQTYARQLDQHEQQLAGLRDRQAELQKQKTALQAELDRQIDALSF
jgi:chaperonin cofactor prefoldin